MARKGTATVKKTDKYIYIDSDGEELDQPPAKETKKAKKAKKRTKKDKRDSLVQDQHVPRNDDPPASPEPPNHASRARPKGEPGSKTIRQSNPPANAPSPPNNLQTAQLAFHPAPNTSYTRSLAAQEQRSPTDDSATSPLRDTMASIPPNQQRNMRACMVCSIVRTQQQFLNNGCPNCEDFLELVGNSEQINDCTSQVFDGLISVTDTRRSWVARYQRLEGYVPGVYATQVEGILPEDVLVAVENAGVNYVPRDGSEQDMLPKD